MNQVNKVIVQKVKTWLHDHNKSIQWLAEEIGVSKSLMGHILTGERQFLPERMAQVARVMGITVDDLLITPKTEENTYTLLLRGKAESRVAKRHLSNMLFAIEDCLRVKQDLSVGD
jgi:transcriptional regulator with XRE-family HTH domain